MAAGKLAGALLAAVLCLQSEAAPAASAAYKIVTASERGTYFAIGTDLAKFVAPAADIDLEVLPTAGSAANIRLLRYEPGVKFAIVQADVYQAGRIQGEPHRGGASDVRSRAQDDCDPAEVRSLAGDRVHQGEERDSSGAGVRGEEAQLRGRLKEGGPR